MMSLLQDWTKAEIPVYMISGNHDSAERLSFGAKLFESSDIYISQVYDGEMKRIVLKDQYGPISVYLLPFFETCGSTPCFAEG